MRKNYTVSEYPEDLKTKVYLLKHFEKYIMDRLYGDYGFCYTDTERTKGMNFVQKYLRMKHVIVFKLSHDTLQVSLSSSSLTQYLSSLLVTVQLLRPLEDHPLIAGATRHAPRQGLHPDALHAQPGHGDRDGPSS